MKMDHLNRTSIQQRAEAVTVLVRILENCRERKNEWEGPVTVSTHFS